MSDEAALQAAHGHAGQNVAAADDLLGSITLQMLRETFDQWTIGETSGRLLAFRSGTFAAEGPESLKRACVTADTATGLGEQLCIQAWLGSLRADELETVWRVGTAAVRP